MSAIDIRRTHTLSLAQARALAERMAARLSEQFDLDYAWEARTLRFRRDGVEGALTVARREIRIEARLGFLLSLLQPRIEREILAQLDEVLGQQDADPPGDACARRR
jgi:putative polyhydroxyalkanoate system protein